MLNPGELNEQLVLTAPEPGTFEWYLDANQKLDTYLATDEHAPVVEGAYQALRDGIAGARQNERGISPAFLSHEIDNALVATGEGAQWLASQLEEYAWAGYLIEGIMAVAAPAKYAVGKVIDLVAGEAIEFVAGKATDRALSVGNSIDRSTAIGIGVVSAVTIGLALASASPIRSFTNNLRRGTVRVREVLHNLNSSLAQRGLVRPRIDPSTNLLSPESVRHVLFGEPRANGGYSGGHIWPANPGKSSFPIGWDADRIARVTSDIATNPNYVWRPQTGTGGLYTNNGDPAKFIVRDLNGNLPVVDGATIRVIVEPAGRGIVTSFAE